jgi:hypothetical protein
MDVGEPITATEIIGILREHEASLRAAGIRALSLFGSVARGEPKPTAIWIWQQNSIRRRRWT